MPALGVGVVHPQFVDERQVSAKGGGHGRSVEAGADNRSGTPGVTRKILSQQDGPTPGYVTVLVEATIEAGVPVGRHTHPGIESAFVLEGGFELPVAGQPTRMLKVGDGFQIPPNTPHAGGKPGDREKSLETALAQIERQFGRGSIMRLGDEARAPIEVIPTGAIALDVAAM